MVSLSRVWEIFIEELFAKMKWLNLISIDLSWILSSSLCLQNRMNMFTIELNKKVLNYL